MPSFLVWQTTLCSITNLLFYIAILLAFLLSVTQVLSLSPSGNAEEQTLHVHDSSCYEQSCTVEAHTHDETCYTCTVTYEGAAFAYLKNGANVSIVYPTEGVVASNAMTAIVKDCEHLAAAKAFVDFVTSKEVQDLFGTVLLSRPVRADAELAEFIPSAESIVYFQRSQEKVAAHKDAVIEKFNEIFADAQG